MKGMKSVDSCNSFMSEKDIKRVRLDRKPCAARSWERRRHAITKFKRAITMKITVEVS